MSDLSLSQLLQRGLNTASQVLAAPSANDVAVQALVVASLSDLTLCAAFIERLSILSTNETIGDVGTKDLRCLLVDAFRGEMEMNLRTRSSVERVKQLLVAKERYKAYVTLVERYEVLPEEKRRTFAGPQFEQLDPSRRRESKIAQFKMEREINGKLNELRIRRRTSRPSSSRPSAVMSSGAEVETPGEEDDSYNSDDDESSVSRPLFLNLLLLYYLKSHAELSSIEMELEVLRHGIAMSDLPSLAPSSASRLRGAERERDGDEADGTWKLDRLALADSTGPLLDPTGRILRPFTILPSTTSSLSSSGLSTRLRLQDEVFRESHRLPTMTIDEFLDQEQERGNILQGGGPRTTQEVEDAREVERGGKEDDTERGRQIEEDGLAKIRDWDEYTDTHRKGEGNMHNRG